MQAKIQKLADGLGLVLPRELMDKYGFTDEATITAGDNCLILTPSVRRPRQEWTEALSAIPQAELERDFEELRSVRETPDEWDATGWTWPETDQEV